MNIFPFKLFANCSASNTPPAPRGQVDALLQGLSRVADRVENLHYRFGEAQNPDGFVQLWCCDDHWLQIHRLWALQPNKGNGSRMLQALCTLADEHDVGIQLKVLPIGRKPYPMSRARLKQWYERFGFEGKRWKLRRMPQTGNCEPHRFRPETSPISQHPI